tara:strand:+ start:249 stop:671 length:423 start_codon:yes stop_codon:yes gene_type:complete
MAKDLKESGSAGSTRRMQKTIKKAYKAGEDTEGVVKDAKRKKVTVEKDGNYSQKTVEYKKGRKKGAVKSKSTSTSGQKTRKSTEVSRGGYGNRTTTNSDNPGDTFVTKGKYGEKPTSERVKGKKATKAAKKSQKKLLKNK